MNMVEKILAKKAGKKEVAPGDVVVAEVDYLLMHDFSCYMVRRVFDEEVKADKVRYPDRVVIVFDHWFSAPNEEVANILYDNRQFAARHGITHLYDSCSGICHYVMIENGFVRPGSIIVGSDSHTCCYGAFGAFSTGLGNQSIGAMVLPFGKAWFKVPETIKISLPGRPPRGVVARDMVAHVIGNLGENAAIYKAIEYAGPVVEEMEIMDRFILCVMAVELGAKAGYVNPDGKTRAWAKTHVQGPYEIMANDPGVEYEKVIELNVSKLEPQVACPPKVENTVGVSGLDKTPINQAEVGGCTGGRLEDLKAAATILKGRRVAPGIRFNIVPGSRQIYHQALKEGLLEIFFQAGAQVFPPGCGSCQTVNMGALNENEAMVFTQPRNFPGRAGSPKARVYLASPLTVAASAIKGYIADPREFI